MGKYTRKAKTTGDVAVMDVSQPFLGVRTRAKTLALRRLQTSSPSPKPDTCYLELRSRRLEKHMQSSFGRKKDDVAAEEEKSIEAVSFFGENNLDKEEEATERGTRESTPCSLIRDDNTITVPGSTTKKTCSSAAPSPVVQNDLMNVPSVHELDEFFGPEDQSQQRHFIDKYNFDVVNDVPLPGRYEWVKVMP